MRLLEFGPFNEEKRFVLCYQALVFARAPLARNELRAHGRLLTALEAIGEVSNPGRDKDAVQLWHCVAGGTIRLEEDEFAILHRFLEAFVPDVHRALSREMDAAIRAMEVTKEAPASA